MQKTSQNSIYIKCAPTLLGFKTANLFSFKKTIESRDTVGFLGVLGNSKEKNISIEKMRETEDTVLMMVYNSQLMMEYLNKGVCKKFLEERGYLIDAGLDSAFLKLKAKIAKKEGFPHEIGVFLGYPIEDVYGFMENEGRNYKYSGYWKVYNDVDRCKERFATFDYCSKYFFRIMKGAYNGRSKKN